MVAILAPLVVEPKRSTQRGGAENAEGAEKSGEKMRRGEKQWVERMRAALKGKKICASFGSIRAAPRAGPGLRFTKSLAVAPLRALRVLRASALNAFDL